MKHRRLAGLLFALVAATAACGAAPAAPLVPTPTGTTVAAPAIVVSWAGTFNVATCTGWPCSAPSHGPERLSLRLSGSSGVLLIGPPTSRPLYPLAVDVTSVAAGSGFVISGKGPVPAGIHKPGTIEVRLDLSSLGETMSGTVSYTVTTGDGARTTKQGPIVSGARETSVAPSRFQGVWAGRMTRTSCVGDCAYDPFVYGGDIKLDIVQTGATITASYNSVVPTWTGTAGGTVINLSYRVQSPGCQAQSEVDSICLGEFSISAVADDLDRMTGTLTYHLDWIAEKGIGRYSVTGTADLTRVARW